MAKGSKKKPFIDKKHSSTYSLLHRSQRDVADSAMVLWPTSDNNNHMNERATDASVLGTMSDWRRQLEAAGLLHQDPKLKPISGTGTFLDASTGHVAQHQRPSAALTSIYNLDIAEETLVEVDRQLDSIPLTADCMDEEIAAVLFGNDDYDAFDMAELNDDFVLMAAKEPEDGDEALAFDYDAHIQQLLQRAKQQRDSGGVYDAKDQTFFSNLQALHENEDDDDSWAQHNAGGTTVATTPGVVSALSPEAERALCEKFEETLAEYDSEEDPGDCPNEDIHGTRDLEGDAHLEAALDDFLLEKEDDVLIYGNREKRKGGSGYSALVGKQLMREKDILPDTIDVPERLDETLARAAQILSVPPQKPPEEDVLIDGQSYYSARERNPFDCQSILSTYSNLDNNPVTIGVSRPRKKKNQIAPQQSIIQLSNKSGLPLGVLPSRTTSKKDTQDLDTAMSVNRGESRNKSETTLEKKARKALVKQERHVARVQKKVTREIFQDEFQKRAINVGADETQGKTVFRY
jgi:protein LTV1